MDKVNITQVVSAKEAGYLAHIAYDSVIFGFDGKQLRILISEYHNTKLFALPGGFVKINESLDDAVRRGLRERTGLDNIYLEQFHVFGSLERYIPEAMEMIMNGGGNSPVEDCWLLDRFISVGYYALINYDGVNPQPDELSDSCCWYNIDQLPTLMQDHNMIVAKALETLRDNLDKKLVGMNLLPERFTMKELQTVYELILGQNIRRTTFQRSMLAKGILNRHEKQFTGKSHKAPFLYSFKKDI